MRVKDMFLRNYNYLFNFFIIIFFLFSENAYSNTNDKFKILNYLNSLQNFSATFLQSDGENISEGNVYIGTSRVRVEYYFPTKIMIILDEDKAMYYDYELDEDEFFNPKNTNAWFFYDIFRNPLFFEDGLVKFQNNELVIEKKEFNSEDENYLIRVFFETSPLILRGIEVVINDDILNFSIYNHIFNEEYEKDFFKLINPKFFN